MSWGRGVWRRQVCTVFHLVVITIRGWCYRVGGDGIDVGGPDDAHPGPTVVFHAHADTYSNSSNDPHDEYDAKHYASNGCARENIPNIGIVGATVGCGSITAVRFAVFATLSKAIFCVDKEQHQLRKQDPWTPGQPPRVHPSQWPEVARQDKPTERRTDRCVERARSRGTARNREGTGALEGGQMERATLRRAGWRGDLAMALGVSEASPTAARDCAGAKVSLSVPRAPEAG